MLNRTKDAIVKKTAGWWIFKKDVAVTAAEVVAGAVGIPVVCAAGPVYAASEIVKYCNKRNKKDDWEVKTMIVTDRTAKLMKYFRKFS